MALLSINDNETNDNIISAVASMSIIATLKLCNNREALCCYNFNKTSINVVHSQLQTSRSHILAQTETQKPTSNTFYLILLCPAKYVSIQDWTLVLIYCYLKLNSSEKPEFCVTYICLQIIQNSMPC